AVVGVRIIRISDRVAQSISSPPGQTDRGRDRIVVPQVIPPAPITRRVTAIPPAVPAVMIVKEVLPIIAGLIAIALPVFANLIAILMPILALLAPIAGRLLTAKSLTAGQPILQSVAALFGRSIGQLAGTAITQARQAALAIANAVGESRARDGARPGGRQV